MTDARGAHALSIDVPSAVWVIDAIDAFVGAAATSAGLGADSVQDVQVAVHEAVLNALVHGNRQDEARRINLRVSMGVEGLEVDVQDQGQGFDASAVPDPRAAQNVGRSSGRGIFFMRALMDGVAFLPRAGGGTHVRMLKRRTLSSLRRLSTKTAVVVA
ncbi:MAG TPA: ATP-binding protein [Vicinamibacteria bacterium]|nr:ATP-binding protein [Vicinamibacteria bacterium]